MESQSSNMDDVGADRRGQSLIFVHSALDDAGLDPGEFRLLAHIARRADGPLRTCFASFKAMAKACRVNKDTVAEKLSSLEGKGWIIRVKRPGMTTGFRIADTPPIRNEGISETEGYPSEPEEPIPSNRTHLSETRGPKDILLRRSNKGIQDGVSEREGYPEFQTSELSLALNQGRSDQSLRNHPITLPPELDTPAFRAAWDRYIEYRKQSKLKPLKPMSVLAQWKTLATYGLAGALESIEASIANGWQGLFPPRSNGSSRPGQPRFEHVQAGPTREFGNN